MADQDKYVAWIDRYVRNELSSEEEAEFELAVLQSEALQTHLENVLGIRQCLRMEDRQAANDGSTASEIRESPGFWRPLALAASILAAVTSVALWRSVDSVAGLERQLHTPQPSYASVVTVPLDVVRSAGADKPDAIISLPTGDATLVLDIELREPASLLDEVRIALVDERRTVLLAWTSNVSAANRSASALAASQLPRGRAWLEISDGSGDVVDRRLIEFR
jgi:hypothetical protein